MAVFANGVYGLSIVREIVFLKALPLCPHLGIANPECGRSFIDSPPTFSPNPFILSPFLCETHWHGDWLSTG
jgi:hypothetical protein